MEIAPNGDSRTGHVRDDQGRGANSRHDAHRLPLPERLRRPPSLTPAARIDGSGAAHDATAGDRTSGPSEARLRAIGTRPAGKFGSGAVLSFGTESPGGDHRLRSGVVSNKSVCAQSGGQPQTSDGARRPRPGQ